jgi:hypothetical protein
MLEPHDPLYFQTFKAPSTVMNKICYHSFTSQDRTMASINWAAKDLYLFTSVSRDSSRAHTRGYVKF